MSKRSAEHVKRLLNLAAGSLIVCRDRPIQSSSVRFSRFVGVAASSKHSSELMVGGDVIGIARYDLSKLLHSFRLFTFFLKHKRKRISRE